jgi:cell wall-associated NlpC family hydrolase
MMRSRLPASTPAAPPARSTRKRGLVLALLLAHAFVLSLAAGVAAAAPPVPRGPTGDSPDWPADPALITPRPDTAGAAPGALQRVGERASEIVLTAMHFVGVHYRRGGDSIAAGFDCSGFTRHVFEQTLGVLLPRRADQQAHAAGLVAVPRDQLQPGDLVFFNTLRRTFSHVGIYIGNNRFIHAPRPGGAVRTEDMDYAYWRQRYNGARRAAAEPPAASEAEAQVSGG